MAPSHPLTVYFCDDALPVCDRLGQLLVTIPTLALAGYSRTVAAARAAILAQQPEVVIVDLNFPDGHGLQLIRDLREADLDTIFIILSVEPAAAWRELCQQAGADFYVEKNTPIDQLVDLMEGLAACRTLLRRQFQERRALRLALRRAEETR